MAKDPMGDGGIALSWVAEARVVRRQRMEASTTVQTLLMSWVTTARDESPRNVQTSIPGAAAAGWAPAFLTQDLGKAMNSLHIINKVWPSGPAWKMRKHLPSAQSVDHLASV